MFITFFGQNITTVLLECHYDKVQYEGCELEAPTMSIFIANCILVGTKNRESNALHQSELFLAQQEMYLLSFSTIKRFIYYKTVKYGLRVLYRLQLLVQ